jgi:hypothetical protein
MQQEQDIRTRKKFLLWGAGILYSFSVFKYLFSQKEKKKDTVKMLTQDGRLVEIDKSLLASGSKKITTKELQQWVKNKTAKE